MLASSWATSGVTQDLPALTRIVGGRPVRRPVPRVVLAIVVLLWLALVAWDLSRRYWSTRCWPADVRVGMARTNRATACCATAVEYITVLLESWHGNDRVVSGPVGAAQ